MLYCIQGFGTWSGTVETCQPPLTTPQTRSMLACCNGLRAALVFSSSVLSHLSSSSCDWMRPHPGAKYPKKSCRLAESVPGCLSPPHLLSFYASSSPPSLCAFLFASVLPLSQPSLKFYFFSSTLLSLLSRRQAASRGMRPANVYSPKERRPRLCQS